MLLKTKVAVPILGIMSALILFHQPVIAEDQFPRYDCISPNVDFWVKIYTQFNTSQGVLHDSDDLSVVYEVLDLKPYDAPGARKYNRRRIKAAKAKYERILETLSSNPSAKGKDHRRVAELFGNPTGGNVYRQASRRLRCQIGQRDRFEAGLIRSGAYIDRIRAIFASYGLPEDLAFLPHVESSFNPNAYSKFGAAGMWQFTRSTGKRFMKVGYELDERRDPIQSAHAAAQLLKENYAKLGEWPLAITAYNHGAAGMLKAKRKHGDYPAIFKSYRSRIFKFASRNFYAEFLAARDIAKDHQAHFGALVLDQPTQTHTIEMNGFADFDEICRHFDIRPGIMKKLNPALRTPVLTGQKLIPKGYILRLPAKVSSTLAQADLSLPVDIYHDKQKPSHFYTVQRGDTAGKIARLHGVPLSDLILANNLNRKATIYPRQTLRIPHQGQSPNEAPATTLASAEAPSETLLNETTPLPPLSDTPIATTPDHAEPVLASVIPFKSRPALRKTEKAPLQSEPSLEIVTADVQFENLGQVNGRPIGIIQVEVEETLGHYAEWAKVRTQAIRRLNDLSFGQVLHLHQKVKIPLDQNTPQGFVENRYEFHKRLQEDFFAVYRIEELQAYTVRRGDNYWTLCRDNFKVPLWLLKHCNPETDLADLRFKQKIWIPSVQEITQDDPNDASEEVDEEVPPLQIEAVRSGTLALKKVNSHTSP